MKTKILPPILLITMGLLIGCHSESKDERVPANLEHALGLVDSTTVNGITLHWIAIYADAPEYQPVVAKGEGVTCVDDVGRFLEVLEYGINVEKREDHLPIAAGMTEFLLYMSREDGLWYNFMWADGSINEDYRTSVASFQWWAVRGLRGLGAAHQLFRNRWEYQDLLQRIESRIATAGPHINQLLADSTIMVTMDGEERPGWNLSGAPDQTSELLLALAGMQQSTAAFDESSIRLLADALLGWQYTGEGPYDGMYYCWQNTWHGWGNNQALALLRAYEITGETRYLASVERWANGFVQHLVNDKMLAEVTNTGSDGWATKEYPQIAYGVASTYRGLKLLSETVPRESYEQLSEAVFAWFKGANAAKTTMYDAGTGRCFDGINDERSVNRNSGAESTIECLLAIQARGGW